MQEEPNPSIDPLRDGLSTFALDVDTGSYTIGKRFVEDGYLPDRASVRTEEYVNARNYHYPQPRSGDDFAIHLMGGVTPFETFPAADVADVLALLDEQPQMRVQLAVVKHAAGNMDRLLVWLGEARKDWWDVLAAAEYPRQAGFGPGEAPMEAIAADLAEYLAWLGEGS